ncbi:histone H2A-beta, sperm-like [Hippopotamus amphibius kiboko]|uniref:histone H2A-beta, sperm-like n=1 Tax=Hippopotamus amphibius kiboko TaxID=575201 RepID=UPI002592EBC2|nr:histone H2A-beta, sperm-like [Hippopotamus amphibius kiboko]
MSRRSSSQHYPQRGRHTVFRSIRAELQFPVSCVDRLLRQGPYAHRLSSSTPVFLTGVIEYLLANILDLTSKEALNNHKTCVTPEHVHSALDNNDLLSRLSERGAFSQTPELPPPQE